MRHIFLVNPAAGRHSAYDWVRARCERVFPALGESYSILVTRGRGHATTLARRAAETGGPVRLYAVGGDGTLNETLQGAFGCPDAEVACVPAGSGNDYIKNFGPAARFRDIAAQVRGSVLPVDLLRCGDRLACNVASVGFDAEAAYHLELFKRLPLVTGSGAYLLSMLYCLSRKVKNHFSVQIDGGEEFSGRFLLISCPSGVCYGGSFRPLPNASVTDGRAEFLLVRSISRLRFLQLVGNYRAGRLDRLASILTRVPGRRIRFRSDVPFAVNLDGECFLSTETSFELQPAAARFVLPAGIAFPPKSV